MVQFMMHHKKDTVGVVVVDVSARQRVEGRYLDTGKTIEIEAGSDIPLGHKLAVKSQKVGDTVIKYGHDVGEVTSPIKVGEHVHIHNMKTKRW